MRELRSLVGLLLATGVGFGVGCSAGGDAQPGLGAAARAGSAGSGGAGGTGVIIAAGGSAGMVNPMITPDDCNPCSDFPAEPILEAGVPENAPELFAQPASGAGPCLLEPADGSLLPNNWLRPRINVKGAPAGAIFQITFHAERETNDLVVYTTNPAWSLPKEIWTNLAGHVWEEDITVTVRQSDGSGAPSETVVKFQVAPVPAGGSMVFWGSNTTTPGLTTSALYGFAPGEEGVITALTPGQISEPILDDSPTLKREQYGAPKGQVRCVGCHTSAPGGEAVIIADHWPWNTRVANINPGNGEAVGARPSWVTPLGGLITNLPWQGVSTTSKADWDAGRRRYVSSFAPRTIDMTQSWLLWASNINKTGKDDLAWFDLAAPGSAPDVLSSMGNTIPDAVVAAYGTAWGLIAREGDTRGAVTPSWSHDGTTIAYTSTDSTSDGHVGDAPTVADIWTVPFNDGAGGPAAAVPGASEASAIEYYPTFSADDRLIAYNRVDDATGPIYYRPDAEIYVVSAAGGTARRLAANDPPACLGEASPGIINSWPKWSPVVREANGKKYYFVIFSSARDSPGTMTFDGPPSNNDPRMSQLYMATIVDDGSGTLEDYPAVYLWNQRNLVVGTGAEATIMPMTTSNVTPAWDEFVIPPVPPVVVK